MEVKKNMLVCGTPTPVLSFFMKNIYDNYNITFIGYLGYLQYNTIKNKLKDSSFIINKSISNIFRIIKILPKVFNKKGIDILIIFGNRSLPNILILLFMKGFYPDMISIFFPYDLNVYSYKKRSIKNRLYLYFEKVCFKKSDKIITKGFKDELVPLERTHNIKGKPHYVFNNFIDENEIANKTCGINKEKVNLVYIGGIGTRCTSSNNYEPFKQILRNKKFILHVYPNRSGLSSLDDLRSNKNLVVHNYVDNHSDFIKEISKYDFGLNLFKASKSSMQQAKMASSIKNYGYLSAGLPIIIDEEHEYMANFIKKNGFGIVIPISELKNLDKYIDKNNYGLLVSSVNNNRKKYFNENEEDKIRLNNWMVT